MKLNKLVSALLFVLIIFPLLLAAVTMPGVAFASGNTTAVSAVLTDLKKDSSFDVKNYPAVSDDFSLSVIQIGESLDEELYIYVYRPSGQSELCATSINISRTIDDNIKFANYKLAYINSYATIDKYRVIDFKVDNSLAVRYYSISSILRAWNKDIDAPAPSGNVISETAFEVGQKWQAMTKNDGDIEYAMSRIETITIENKFVGFLRYSNGFFLSQNSCDSHFVAFSTDKQIEQLLEADVEYYAHHYTKEYWLLIPKETHGPSTKYDVTLSASEIVSNPADGLFAKKYIWNRIESVADFIQKEQLTDDAKSQLQKMQWVLRFSETEYSYISSANHSIENKDIVSDVTILRLKFNTAGRIYNIGAVDNKQSNISPWPDNNNQLEMENPAKWVWEQIKVFFKANWKWFVIAFASVLAIIIVIFVLRAIWRRPKVTVINSDTRSRKNGKNY